MNTTINTIEILQSRFPGIVNIPFVDAAVAYGFQPQTARNKLSQVARKKLGDDSFPFPTFLIGSRRFVHIAFLAEAIDSASRRNLVAEGKHGPGKPKKSERLEAERLGITVPQLRQNKGDGI